MIVTSFQFLPQTVVSSAKLSLQNKKFADAIRSAIVRKLVARKDERACVIDTQSAEVFLAKCPRNRLTLFLNILCIFYKILRVGDSIRYFIHEF